MLHSLEMKSNQHAPVRARPATATTPTGVRMPRSISTASSQTWEESKGGGIRRSGAGWDQAAGSSWQRRASGSSSDAARAHVWRFEGARARQAAQRHLPAAASRTSMSPVVSLKRISCSGRESPAG